MKSRDLYIASNCIADAIVKAEFLDNNELAALIKDVDRWRADEPGEPGDALIDAYQTYLRALQTEARS